LIARILKENEIRGELAGILLTVLSGADCLSKAMGLSQGTAIITTQLSNPVAVPGVMHDLHASDTQHLPCPRK
jgi:hypothetical protein